MSIKLDANISATGTKFKIFPQPRFLSAFSEPETIRVSVTPSEMQAGPADERMYVLDAISKVPYDRFNQRPYTGLANPPIQPRQDGHYDHFDVDSREFSCAAMYATVRRALDIWEDYFGRRIDWHFGVDFDRLELIPLVTFGNAQSGYGFLEFGFPRRPLGGLDQARPYCQNFDVLTHETGHSIIFAEVGIPSFNAGTSEYGGHHEAAGDLVSIISALHFNKVVDFLLEQSKGNLFTINELSRVGELSQSREIRVAFNDLKMSDVSQESHSLSQPLTGAIFDIFVEVFQKELVQAGLISQELADLSYHEPGVDVDDDAIQAAFEAAYTGNHEQFKMALLKARDYLGELLAGTWARISADFFTYEKFGLDLLRTDRDLSGGQHQITIKECFLWREIRLPGDSIALQMRTLDVCRMG